MITSLFQKTIEVKMQFIVWLAFYLVTSVLKRHQESKIFIPNLSDIGQRQSQPVKYGVSQNHRPPTTDPPAGVPTTQGPPKPTTDSPTGPPPTHRSPTHRPYYNWPTTLWLTNLILTESPLDQFLSTTNFNSSFGMGTTYYWIGKAIYKMTDKKELW